jgi:hypothetical protein
MPAWAGSAACACCKGASAAAGPRPGERLRQAQHLRRVGRQPRRLAQALERQVRAAQPLQRAAELEPAVGAAGVQRHDLLVAGQGVGQAPRFSSTSPSASQGAGLARVGVGGALEAGDGFVQPVQREQDVAAVEPGVRMPRCDAHRL